MMSEKESPPKNVWGQLRKRFNWLIIFGFIFAVGAGLDFSTSVGVQPNFSTKTVPDVKDPSKTVSLTLVSYPTHYYIIRILSSGCYSLATSLFISVFIISTFESVRIREEEEKITQLRAAVNKDVFDSIFKTLMPPEIFAAVKEQIIANKLIRRNAKWIHIFKENGNSIVLKQTISYELHNLSLEAIPNAISLKFQESAGSKQKLIKASCKSSKGNTIAKFNDIDHSNNVGISDELYPDDPSITSKIFNIKVPPKDFIEIEMVFLYEYYEGVQDAYFSRYPVVDAELTAFFPENYIFHVFPALSSLLKNKISEDGYHLYEMKGGTLPFQGYSFKLIRKVAQDQDPPKDDNVKSLTSA